MPLEIHTLRRADLPENGVAAFEAAGAHRLVADFDGGSRRSPSSARQSARSNAP